MKVGDHYYTIVVTPGLLPTVSVITEKWEEDHEILWAQHYNFDNVFTSRESAELAAQKVKEIISTNKDQIPKVFALRKNTDKFERIKDGDEVVEENNELVFRGSGKTTRSGKKG